MLVELAALLVIVGIILLIVGVFIARQYTLRSKLLTAFLVIVLLSIGTLSVIDNYLMRESLTQSANQTLTAAAKQYATRVDQFNNSMLVATKTAARLPSLIKYLKQENARAEVSDVALENLKVMQSGDSNAISYALISPSGINVLDTLAENVGIDESNNDYYGRAIKNGGVYRSPVTFINNTASLFFSSVVKDASGKTLGHFIFPKKRARFLIYIQQTLT